MALALWLPFILVVLQSVDRTPFQTEGQSTARLKILVVDSWGKPVSHETRVRINGEGVAQTLTVAGRGSVDLPFGQYAFECSGPGFSKTVRMIEVRRPRPEALCVLPLRRSEGVIWPWVVSGRLSPMPKAPAIVRLVGVFLDSSSEVEVAPNGMFSVDTVAQGRYLLMVLVNGTVLYQKEVDIHMALPDSVELGTLALPSRE